jgi:putative DNA primase/helicase
MTPDIIQSLKKDLNILDCCKWWLPNGFLKGNEWISKNPMRSDAKAGSFKINTITGAWCDFALHDIKGGDMISLYAYLNNIEKQLDAAKQLISSYQESSKNNIQYTAIINSIIPIPATIPPFVLQNNNGHWVYEDKNGNPILHVVRIDGSDGKKMFKPYTYASINGVAQWANRGIYKDGKSVKMKPLYNLSMLYKRPNDEVLLVEGEKAADAANRLLPDYVSITWLGGANNAGNADLEHLKDRIVWLWPDNDDAGRKAMSVIKKNLKGIAKSCKIVDLSPLGKLKEKWDLGDAKESYSLVSCFKEDETRLDKDYFPYLSEKGAILNMPENIEHLLNFYKIKIRYNMMTNYPEFYAEDRTYSTVNEAHCYFVEIFGLCVLHGVPRSSLENYILYIADKNKYHPAREMIESKEWDKQTRIAEFINTIVAEDQELALTMIFKWMVGCVALLYQENGLSLDGSLIFQGEQGIGKTSWLLNIVPNEYKHLVKSGLFVDPNNKDSVMNVTSCWIGEMAEMDIISRKSDVSSLKGFLTQSIDYYRVPFGKLIRPIPRRTAFFGSVNPQNFLADETGNRRYWVIKAKEINYDHKMDMQQVWAEIKHYYDKGENFRLTKEEMSLINKSNESFELIEPLEEKIKTKFNWDENPTSYKTCTEILELIGYERPTKSEANKLALILKKMGIQKGNGRERRSYFVPRLKIEISSNW